VKPLLAIDGDSFAHRAYHALPKSINRNAVVGFTNMVTRLWEVEEPRAVVVGWDTLEVPTYRHKAFEAYQSGREFDRALLDQLAMLPELCTALAFPVGKAPGYEADDFLAAAVAAEEARGGTVLVASGDRDAFQLASERTTILQPLRGVSEIARVGPAEVRERYGVEPEQVPDFIALRGDPSDGIPGAKGIGEKTARDLLREYGTLDAAIENALRQSPRVRAALRDQADELRDFRRMATLQPIAVKRPPDRPTDFAAAAGAAEGLGMRRLAERLRGLTA
jgi:DNA polymerase-1